LYEEKITSSVKVASDGISKYDSQLENNVPAKRLIINILNVCFIVILF
jgi:hypothetical protein